MIYLDSGATSFHKPPRVYQAVAAAMRTCANPGRGGYVPAMEAARRVYGCREAAADLFECRPEQVVLTTSCTHGLNIAIRSLVKPGGKVVVTGFEHNAVTRPLHALNARIQVAGRRLFDREDSLEQFEQALRSGADAAVFTHVSNVFGYVLPVEEMAALCRSYGVRFAVDAAQSAGSLPVSLKTLGADFVAMPGHKGLLGPQGTGLLLCGEEMPAPLLQGGTGSESLQQEMPEYLPDRLEAGTLNVPGFAGLTEGLRWLKGRVAAVGQREHRQAEKCAKGLKQMGMRVFFGEHQAGTLSFLPGMDCETAAELLGRQGIAVRAGLHCAPYAHESAGTLETGTVRVSFGYDCTEAETAAFLRAASKLPPFRQ